MKPLTVEKLNSLFSYVKDADQYGHREAWFIMKKAPYAGDCEDYSLTLLYNLKGRSLYKMLISLLIRESKICHCKVKGNGHAVLKYKGRYIDNIQKKWCQKHYLESRDYVFSSWLYIPYQVIVKVLIGYIKSR